MEYLIALKSMPLVEVGLSISLLMNFRLWYKYSQLDKIVLLIADRSHRDIIKIERDGNYSIAQPLNKPRKISNRVDKLKLLLSDFQTMRNECDIKVLHSAYNRTCEDIFHLIKVEKKIATRK